MPNSYSDCTHTFVNMKWHFASNMRVRSKRAARVLESVERLDGRSFAWVEFPELRVLFGSHQRQPVRLPRGFAGCGIRRTFPMDRRIKPESLAGAARCEQDPWMRRQQHDEAQQMRTPRKPRAGGMPIWYRDAADWARRLCGVVRIEAGGFAAFRKLFGRQASRGRWRALEVR